MTPVLFIRHGLTQWNLERRIQGLRQTRLQPLALRQLRQQRLPGGWQDAEVHVSPLRRCRQTAQALGLRQARTARALREMDWGEWEGRRLRDLHAEQGAAMLANEARGLDFRPDRGESPRQVRRRLRHWLARRARQGRAFVAVTHKGVIRAALSLATGWQMRSQPPLRLEWDCAHEFALSRSGRLYLSRPNIALAARVGPAKTSTEPRP